MIYFVTGGSGLLGQWLLSALVRQGHTVRASYRGAPPTTLPEGAAAGAVEWVEGDVLDPLFLQQAVADVDIVYHCAAIVSFAPRDADLQWQVNVAGTTNVVDALLSHAPRARLCHVSSVAALGTMPDGSSNVDETAQWDPAADHTAYAESKYAAELEVWRGINEGLASVIVNPSVILAPADPKRSSTQLFRYAQQQHRYYPGGHINLVDVRDVVAALLALPHRDDLLGERYVLSAGAISYREFFGLAAEALHRRPPSVQLPQLLAEILWRAEAVKARLTGAAPLLTRDSARTTRRAAVFNAARAQQALRLTFHNPAESVRWAAEALRGKLA
jgi:dihydroflavonol-4-reductase